LSLWSFIRLVQTPYCERLGPGPIAEPLNAISNLAFIIAAILAARRMRELTNLSLEVRLLPWSLGVVAVGSALYHTYRSPGTYILDVVPLTVFIAGSIYLVLRKVLGGPSKALGVGAAFVLIQLLLLIIVPRHLLNGSTPYLVAILFIPLIMAWIARRYGSLAWKIVPVAVLFTLAFVLRTVDGIVCPWLSVGTHFLWHITAAAAAYYVIRLVVLIEAADQQRADDERSIAIEAAPLRKKEGA
jgi:hypothetical protein